MTVRLVSRNFAQDSTLSALGEVDPPDPSGGVDAHWESAWRDYHVRRALHRLGKDFNEKDRIAFTMYAMEGHGARETARSLGLSVDQVYQAKSCILRRISQMVAEQVKEEG